MSWVDFIVIVVLGIALSVSSFFAGAVMADWSRKKHGL